MLRVYICIVFIIGASMVSAQTCCSGGVPVSSNIGFQSSTKNNIQIGLSANFNWLNALFADDKRLNDQLRERSTQSILLRLAYQPSDRFSIETMLPYVRQTRTITTNRGDEDFEQTNGVGDPILLFIYDFIKTPSWTYRFGIGPQFPLGSTAEVDKRGLVLVEDLQPGSGSYNVVLFQSIETDLIQFRPSGRTFLNAIYRISGKNTDARNGTQTYQFGNDLQIIVGYSDNFVLFKSVWNLSLGARYRNVREDKIDDFRIAATGGDFIFARASVGYPLLKLKSQIFFNTEIPIYTRVNETQVASTFLLNTGIYYALQ